MGKSATPAIAAATVPHVRVDTANTETRVTAGGHDWAGRSEVPASTLTALQLQQLKNDKRLTVETFDREIEPVPDTQT